jgi:YjbE family integral membrane protein
LDAFTHSAYWLGLTQIIALNLVLSGDNAVVIALACRHLHGQDRHRAALLGGILAVVLRLGLTFIAVQLLALPGLKLMGGLLLLWMAWNLVEHQHPGVNSTPSPDSLTRAIRMIVTADVVMSLDNVLALVAVAGDDPWLLIPGLATSIPLVILGGSYLGRLMDRLPILVVMGGTLLAFVAGQMMAQDTLLELNAPALPWTLCTLIGLRGLLMLKKKSHP